MSAQPRYLPKIAGPGPHSSALRPWRRKDGLKAREWKGVGDGTEGRRSKVTKPPPTHVPAQRVARATPTSDLAPIFVEVTVSAIQRLPSEEFVWVR